MTMDFLYEFTAPVVVGICLCVGYILKHLVPGKTVDRFIPLLMGALGVLLTAWVHWTLTPELLLSGLFSGLASTGLHQAFKQCVERKENDA